MTELQLYSARELDDIIWPDSPDSHYAQRVLVPLIQQGTQAYIENVDIDIQLLKCEELIFPVAISKPQSPIHNSYVCSPTTHYIDYARVEVEIELSKYPLLKHPLDAFIKNIGRLFHMLQFEKVVYVNNWLLSTNLYPEFKTQHLVEIRDFLIQKFPEHVLIFRSVNLELNQDIYQELKSAGFIDIISRQVYILDPSKGQYKKKKSYKEDCRLSRKSLYTWHDHNEITTSDIPRIRYLYDQLYLKKYSKLNPQFSELFMRKSIEHHWLQFWVLKKEGQIDACIGYFERNGVLTTPLVGYDFSVPRKAGLYRLITLKLIEESQKNNWILNASSGASDFKRSRACEPSLEYNMVFFKHLSQTQQIPWKGLKALSKSLAVPILEKFEL